jgi:NADPH2 dehydrogenase
MGMKDPLPTFTTLVECIRDAHPNFAYVHAVEPRVDGVIGSDLTDENRAQSNEAFRKVWGDRPYIAAGGIDGATAMKMVEKYGGLVAFGRDFIANVSRVFSVSGAIFSEQHFSLISLCA